MSLIDQLLDPQTGTDFSKVQSITGNQLLEVLNAIKTNNANIIVAAQAAAKDAAEKVVNTKIGELDTKIDNLNIEIGKVDAKIGELYTKADVDAKIGELYTKTDVDAMIKGLAKSMAGVVSTADGAKLETESMKTGVSDLKGKVSAIESKWNHLSCKYKTDALPLLAEVKGIKNLIVSKVDADGNPFYNTIVDSYDSVLNTNKVLWKEIESLKEELKALKEPVMPSRKSKKKTVPVVANDAFTIPSIPLTNHRKENGEEGEEVEETTYSRGKSRHQRKTHQQNEAAIILEKLRNGTYFD